MFTTPDPERLFGGLIAAFFLGCLVCAVFTVWMIFDCLRFEPSQGYSKLVWLVVIFFGLGVGPLIYFLVRRPERISLYGR